MAALRHNMADVNNYGQSDWIKNRLIRISWYDILHNLSVDELVYVPVDMTCFTLYISTQLIEEQNQRIFWRIFEITFSSQVDLNLPRIDQHVFSTSTLKNQQIWFFESKSQYSIALFLNGISQVLSKIQMPYEPFSQKNTK